MEAAPGYTTTRAWIRQGAFGGLVAGMAMAMIAMLYTLLAQGDLLAPLKQMGATFFPTSSGSAISLVAGAMLHMMVSVIVGIGFALVVKDRVTGLGPLALAGMAFIAVEWAIARFVVLPIIDAPLVATFGAGGGIVAHLMYGVAAAAWLDRSAARSPATAATLTHRPA